MAYKVLESGEATVPEGRSGSTGGSTRAADLLSDIRLDYKPVVQTRYEPMERKY